MVFTSVATRRTDELFARTFTSANDRTIVTVEAVAQEVVGKAMTTDARELTEADRWIRRDAINDR